SSESSRRESFLQMQEVLSMGLHMCIYPEGTRNKTGQPLKSFHDGAFRLALVSRKAIIPALIFNTRKVNPPSKGFFLLPHRMFLHFLEPIHSLPDESLESLKKRTFDTMWNFYVQHSGE
ncbi:MAG TPA: lysophospholipid acyltransferase family protein, partial [Puia sp.]|nr:lysophospholipid acyltransferase family protein [Puia sp.]